MNVFARKTSVSMTIFTAVFVISFAIVPHVYADLAGTDALSVIANAKLVDGKYTFDEAAFENMTEEQINNIVGDLPRGHWAYTDVQKTRKGYVLKDGKIESSDIPYTAKVRTGYVLEDYNIVYGNLVDGSVAPDTKTFKYDTPTFDLQPASNTSDWIFEGWYTGENGSGARIGQIIQYTKTDITLYANYVPNFYIVRFSANGGDGLVNDIKVKRNTEITLPDSPMKKRGCNFIGWNTTPDRTGEMLGNQACVNNLTNGNDISLYAQYDPISYTVSFDSNGGVGAMPSQSISYDTTGMLAPSSMEKDGKRFCGWNTRPDGSGEWYADAGTVRNLAKNDKEEIVLYAQYDDPTSPNPFSTMSGTVFVGDSAYANFNPMTTSYNMEGMPKQISLSDVSPNFAVESIETSNIKEIEGINTIEKSQQTLIKVRYYGMNDSQERVYKFNWEWTESMGSAFGREITTVPVFKHGVSYPAGSYLVGTDIKSGSYVIEYEGNSSSVSLTKSSGDSRAMKSGSSYDVADGDMIDAQVPFYLIVELNTSTIKNSEMINGIVQEANEASLRGDGMYVEVDPLRKVVPSVIKDSTYDLTTSEGIVDNSKAKKAPVTNAVIEEVKKEETPEYIQNEIEARTNTTYEVITPGEENKGNGEENPEDSRVAAYYGTWKFESFTTPTQEIMKTAERKESVKPQYSDATFSYSDDDKSKIKTIDDFVEADNQIEIKENGTVIQSFKYADEDAEYKSYAKWEPIESNGKIDGIRISAYDSEYTVTASLMSGKLVLDKTSFYASIFKKIDAPTSSPTTSSPGSGTSLGTQSTEDSYGFISPYSVFGYVWEKITEQKPDPATNSSSDNSNKTPTPVETVTVNQEANKYNGSGSGNNNSGKIPSQPVVNKNENNNSAGNNGNVSHGNQKTEEQQQPTGQWQPVNNNSGQVQMPVEEKPSAFENKANFQNTEKTTTNPGPQQPQSSGNLIVVDPQDTSNSSEQPIKVIDNTDGTMIEVSYGEDGTVSYVEVDKDGNETTWLVDPKVAIENLYPTDVDITTKFEEIAKNVEGMNPDTIKIIAESLKHNLDNIGGNFSNGMTNIAISNAVEEAKQNGLISDEQARNLKASAKKGNDDLFKDREEQAIRDFVNRLPDGGTEEGQVLTNDGDQLVSVPVNELRPDRIENSYQNYNAANAPDPTPRNNANNTANSSQMKDDSSEVIGGNGIIAQIASNDVLRAGIVGLPVLIIVLIAAFMFTRTDE